MPRIALIHATPLSMAPITAAFERHWPEAQLMHLLDDSLSRDRERDGELTEAMIQRFIDLATYLAAGRVQEHHRKIAEVASRTKDVDCVMLAQFSMAAAALQVQEEVSCPVLTSPGCAVLGLRRA